MGNNGIGNTKWGRRAVVASIVLEGFIAASEAGAQGCLPLRHVALSLSSEGIRYFEEQKWDVSVSYRFLHSEKVFIEDSEQPQLAKPNGPRLNINSFDVAITRSWNSRWSTSLTVPFLQADASSVRDHADGVRHSNSAGGLGDMRLVQNYWVLDPSKHSEGNISLGLGIKLPTGDDAAADKHFTVGGFEYRPVDISIMPGDGGWDAVLELQAFRRVFRNGFAYASGFYLLSPQEQNGVPARSPTGPHGVYNSIPDQYMARAGISWTFWPKRGLSLSLGPRIDGMPAHDAIGGSYGVRRPGYSIDIEPGINLTQGNLNVGLSAPVALYRFREQSVPEAELHIKGAGGLADFLLMASVSYRF